MYKPLAVKTRGDVNQGALKSASCTVKDMDMFNYNPTKNTTETIIKSSLLSKKMQQLGNKLVQSSQKKLWQNAIKNFEWIRLIDYKGLAWITPGLPSTHVSHETITYDFSLYWLVNSDPYNGLL